MTVNSSGNVGIGTTTPVGRLEVNDGSNTDFIVETTGFVGIGTSNPSAQFDIRGTSANIMHLTTSDYVLNTTGSRVTFDFGAATGNTYTKIQTSDAGGASASNLVLQTDSGNVGIGTTGPNRLLEISSTGDPGLRITNEDYASTFYDINYKDSGGLYFIDKDSQTNVLFGTDGSVAVGSSYATGAVNGPDNGMVIEGNVGIGTTAPSEVLVIGKDLGNVGSGNWIIAGGSSDYPGLALGYDNNNYSFSMWQNSQSVLRMGTKSSTTFYETLAMKEGKVGIGTTGPAHKLDLQGGDVAVQTAQKVIVDSDDTADSYMVHNNANNYISLFIDGTECARIKKK